MAPEMTQETAFITGVTGQDGAYLGELLLAKGYVVHGVKRCSSKVSGHSFYNHRRVASRQSLQAIDPRKL